jgi:hypothetical protein
MTRPPTRCIFCGYSSKLTNEHLYPRWTHKFFPPRSMTKYYKRAAVVYPEYSDVSLIKRPGDMRDWQVKCVCEDRCNNGWMRRNVENKARRVMISLMRGDRFRLRPHQQRLVATWAILKAMVAEYDPTGYVTSHHTHRKFLMNHGVPPTEGWTVWIGHYQRYQWQGHFISIPFLFLSPKQEARRTNNRATYYNSSISTQVIGQLFIQVIRSPARDFIKRWRFTTPEKGALFRIWPPTPFSVSWPSKIMTDRDADYAAGALKTFLEERAYAKRAARSS